MALVPAPIVPAPQQLRRRYGLFDAASGPLDLPAHGEGGGVRYVPENCGGAIAYGIDCYGEGNEAPAKPVAPGDDELIETGAFLVLSTFNCSAVGYTLDEQRAKARARLESGEQAAVERALWGGLDFQNNSLETLSLSGEAEDVDPGYDPDNIISVLAALERYAYSEQGYGGVAYIHAPVEVAAYAANAGLVLPEGSSPNARKLTPEGSIWSFGAYPSGTIIVTGQTTVWRSSDIPVYDAFDTSNNERLLVAERAYAVSFECFAGEAEFDPLGATSP